MSDQTERAVAIRKIVSRRYATAAQEARTKGKKLPRSTWNDFLFEEIRGAGIKGGSEILEMKSLVGKLGKRKASPRQHYTSAL